MAERSTDVLVIGGGVLGLAHAIAAVRRGMNVVLCERNLAARGASVRNFGMVWPIGQPAGADLEVALRSRELWSQTAADAGFRCEASGSMHVAYGDDEWRVLNEFVTSSAMTGLQLMTPDEALGQNPAIVKSGLRGAMFSPHEANVDPAIAIASMHSWLIRLGVDIRSGCPVVEVGDRRVRLADGTQLFAEHIVVCAGDEFRTLFPEAFRDSGLVRCQLQMMSLGPQPAGFQLGPMLAGGLTLLHYEGFRDCLSLPILRDRMERQFALERHRGIHVMVSQGDDGRLIVGDSHDYQEPFAPGIDAETEQLILAYLQTFFRPPVTKVLRRWSGSYAKCSNGQSVFRNSPQSGVEIVTGVGGSGMTRSMALGEQTITAWS